MTPRRIGTLLLAALAGAAITACDPPATPTFVVTSFALGWDADPGDGTCDDGTGQCTVWAAFDEANALGRAHIILPPGDHEALASNLTAQVTLETDTSSDPTASATIGSTELHILPGGSLVSRGVEYANGPIMVDGTLVGDRFSFEGGDLTVNPGGTALLRNAFVGGPFSNSGTVHLVHATVRATGDGPAVETLGGASTTLSATALLAAGTGPACAGATPASLGYNLASDGTCSLTGTGDVDGDPSGDTEPFPAATSPRVDAIPVGTLGCGTDLLTDIRSFPRPTDGNADSTPACDIGAWER